MDERLLRHYNAELQHIKEMGSEFARSFPKIAGRLGMEGLEVADPYVERLFEGFAFLAARVQLQLENAFPRFTEHLLATIAPHYLSPLPSMAIAKFEPDMTEGSLAAGPEVPRGSKLTSLVGAEHKTPCIYKTAHPVRLWPIEIADVDYQTRNIASLDLGSLDGVRAVLRIRLKTLGGVPFSKLSLDSLVLHLRGGSAAAGLYEALFAHAVGVAVHDTGRPPAWTYRLDKNTVRQVGYDPDEGLLPTGRSGFEGHRLLREYFAFPERFLFAAVDGLAPGLAKCNAQEVDISVLLDSADVDLENALGPEHLSLHCTPAINLFERRIDRIHVDQLHSEYHLVPDRTAPLDYEVFSVEEIRGYGSRGEEQDQLFEPFYSARETRGSRTSRHYALRRSTRMLSDKERRGQRRSARYAGSEVYISLVDEESPPYSGDLRQLGGRALCTNRDLPIHMPIGTGLTDFNLDIGVPVKATRCVGAPTSPRAAFPEGETAWRLVGHLMPSYLSIFDTKAGDAAGSLREALALYADTTRPEVRQQVDGIHAVKSEPIVRRIAKAGPVSFARGLEIAVTFDELAFEGAGVFVLGAVLERYFALHATINVFTETVIRSETRGEIKRWPHRHGLRQNI